ncbi:hypothetical protein BC829DRAFT_415638 [Chytridium lagenaria]|nr:hypothetical protein BC829DRAFT_415638 [Chytridium lagenaria]
MGIFFSDKGNVQINLKVVSTQFFTAAIHIGIPVGAVFLLHHKYERTYLQNQVFVVADVLSYMISTTVWHFRLRPSKYRLESGAAFRSRMAEMTKFMILSVLTSWVALLTWYFPVLVTQINLFQLRNGSFWTQFGVQAALSAAITSIQLVQIKLLENFTSTDEFRAAALTMMYSYLLFGMPSKVIRLYGGFEEARNDTLYWILVIGNIVFNKVMPRIMGLLVYQRHLLSKILKVDIEDVKSGANQPKHVDTLEIDDPSTLPDCEEALKDIHAQDRNNSTSKTLRHTSLPSLTTVNDTEFLNRLSHHSSQTPSKLKAPLYESYLPQRISLPHRDTVRFRDDTVEPRSPATIHAGEQRQPSTLTQGGVSFGTSGFSIDADSNTALNAIGKSVQSKKKHLKFDLGFIFLLLKDMYSVYIEDQAMVDLLGIFFASGFTFIYAYEIFGSEESSKAFVRYSPLWRCLPILVLQIIAEIALCRLEKYCGFRVYDGKRLEVGYIYAVALAAVSSGLWTAVGIYGFKFI